MKKKVVMIIILIIAIGLVAGIFMYNFINAENQEENIDMKNKIEKNIDDTETEKKNKYENFEGDWYRTNVFMREQAGIKITEQEEDHFIFELNANNCGSSGYVSGIALIKDESSAIYEVIDEYDLYEEDTYIIFKIEDEDEISVNFTGNYNALGLGNNVFIEGTYTKKMPIYIDANILNEVLYTETIKEKVIDLVGDENYYDVVKVSIELGDHADFVKGEMFSAYARGFGFGIDLLIDENENIYCLIWDTGNYKFYTNDERYKDKLPSEYDILGLTEDTEIEYIYKEYAKEKEI